MNQCIEVSPRSRKGIRSFAEQLRTHFSCDAPCFPIVNFLEFALPRVWEDFCLEICEKSVLDETHGLTYPEDKHMKIREDVYEGACRGEGRDRFTLAHELGHLLLHAKSKGLARGRDAVVPAYKSSEWQANCFAAELLMPVKVTVVNHRSVDLATICGVSVTAAGVRIEQLKKEGLI